MVHVDVWSLTLASLQSVGTIAVMALAGFWMTRLGIITNEVRKGLGELSMNLLLPCLMFSQVIYCNTITTHGSPCPNMAQVILSSVDLFFWPIVVVGSGYILGYLAAALMRVPPSFRRAAAGSVAFGNSTGMPVVLLSTLAPSLIEQKVIAGDPLLFLPVYLVLSPLLQWTVGSYIFRGTPEDKGTGEAAVEAADEGEESLLSSEEESSSIPVVHARTAHGALMSRVEGDEEDLSEEQGPSITRRQTIGVPMAKQVGNGFSAQAEVEDVLAVEDLRMPRRKSCAMALKKALFMFLSPPVAATILGIFVAFIRPIQNQFVDLKDPDMRGTHSLTWLYKSIYVLGKSAVPVNLLMLGSNLSRGAEFSTLPMCTAVVLTITKMLIQPALVAFWVFCLARMELGPNVKGKWLVAIVVSLTPTANNIMVQVELGGQDKKAMTALIFTQYLMAPVLLTISLTATSMLMQVPSFLVDKESFDMNEAFHF
ncbi:unnamed protein product [Durusdinium trenchii]|uniref:Auxin efflux carrier n=1 Tax=Durusdinium trenchii TaxID=1381693 RepID=A0ABP0L1M7_9DINO